jgi:hypothetical protein
VKSKELANLCADTIVEVSEVASDGERGGGPQQMVAGISFRK